MTTQLSACIVTQKLMDNGMKSYSKYKIQKNKTHANRCSELIIHFYIHTHSHGYKIQSVTVNTHNTNLTFLYLGFIIF